MSKMADIDLSLTDIAKKHLAIDTLEAQNSDTLDFHLIAVWTLETMLKEAYAAGRASGIQETAAIAGKRIIEILEK